MAPFKSSLARSATKLLGVFRDRDTSLRGYVQTSRRIPETITVTGGGVGEAVISGGKAYISWTSSGALTVGGEKAPSLSFDYLLVAGGGGGAGYGPSYYSGGNGENSEALGVTAAGGGGGSPYPAAAGAAGGSGGGGGAPEGSAGAGNKYPNAAPTPAPLRGTAAPGQGNPGGSGGTSGLYGGSGGGGAGQAGEGNKPNSQSGYGGYGIAAFSGDTDMPTTYGTPGPSAGRWFCGGGGGAGGTPNPNGGPHNASGGDGGGGDGSNIASGSVGTGVGYGQDNTGGGAGARAQAGGGGAGGGGAGGYLTATGQTLTPGTPYPIVIGDGGGGSQTYYPKGGSGIFVFRIPAPVVSGCDGIVVNGSTL